MKISNSKKELARIISENDGWIAGGFAAQQDDGEIWFSATKPIWKNRCGTFDMGYEGHFTIGHMIANRHQTILSRAEYFHLYPAPNAKHKFCESVMRAIPEPTAKPTIEQLAADYRSAKDYAERKQQEVDAAKADADDMLKEIELAGESIGLLVSPITAKQEPELAITDWRDLRVGDEVEYVEGSQSWSIGMVGVVQRTDDDEGGDMNVRILFGKKGSGWPRKWRFIRRP